MSGNEWFLGLIEWLHSTINTLTMKYFTRIKQNTRWVLRSSGCYAA
jgi:hypothetical protein